MLEFQTSHDEVGRTTADVSRDNSDGFFLRRVLRKQTYNVAARRARPEEVKLAPGDFCVSSSEWSYEASMEGGISVSGLLIPHAVMSPLLSGGRLTRPVPVPIGSVPAR